MNAFKYFAIVVCTMLTGLQSGCSSTPPSSLNLLDSFLAERLAMHRQASWPLKSHQAAPEALLYLTHHQ